MYDNVGSGSRSDDAFLLMQAAHDLGSHEEFHHWFWGGGGGDWETFRRRKCLKDCTRGRASDCTPLLTSFPSFQLVDPGGTSPEGFAKFGQIWRTSDTAVVSTGKPPTRKSDWEAALSHPDLTAAPSCALNLAGRLPLMRPRRPSASAAQIGGRMASWWRHRAETFLHFDQFFMFPPLGGASEDCWFCSSVGKKGL